MATKIRHAASVAEERILEILAHFTTPEKQTLDDEGKMEKRDSGGQEWKGGGGNQKRREGFVSSSEGEEKEEGKKDRGRS